MSELFIIITSLVLTLLFIAFFEGIEIAFVSVNRLGIELRKKQGKSSGIILSKFIEFPARLIETCLVGGSISLVVFTVLLNIVLFPVWKFVGIQNAYVILLINIGIAALVVTTLSQFLPRAIFRAKNDTLLNFFASVIKFFYGIFYPIARVLVNIAAWILKYVFNIKLSEKNIIFNKADLEHFFRQSKAQDEESQELNTELFENALSFPLVKIRQCLVPRTEVEGVDITSTIAGARQRMIETRLSKMIVYDDNIDNIQGYIHQLDLFKNPSDIQAILLPIPAVPESMSATDLITKFSKERKSIAWVVDEFGGTAGIVTMEDVLEEIFGEIKDEHDVEEFVAKQIAEDEYLFSGRLETDYLKEKFGLEFNINESETLSGYIITEYQTIPQQKERIIIDRYEFEILNVSETRIEMVKIKVLR
jgi:CBS domain containing-hemolysin-like protein